MAEEDHILNARKLVLEYVIDQQKDYPEEDDYDLSEIHVIQTAVVLGNWTFLIKTFPSNDYIYEVVHNAHDNTMRLMAYAKTTN